MRIRIGTRGSELALRQAEIVAGLLRASQPGLEFQLIIVRTSGDEVSDRSQGDLAPGNKGGFVKELQRALVEGKVDVAVHSLKDVPLDLPEETVLAAFCEREDPADVLVSLKYRGLEDIPVGGRVGTSSPRRAFQLSLLRPDLLPVPVRGNVITRLEKLRGGECDALVLAAAGLNRLGIDGFERERLPLDLFLPSPGQGIVVVEARRDDPEVIRVLSRIDNHRVRVEAEAERAFCRWVGADCDTRTGALARCRGDLLHLSAFHWFREEKRARKGEMTGRPDEAEELGRRLAAFLSRGGEGKAEANEIV